MLKAIKKIFVKKTTIEEKSNEVHNKTFKKFQRTYDEPVDNNKVFPQAIAKQIEEYEKTKEYDKVIHIIKDVMEKSILTDNSKGYSQLSYYYQLNQQWDESESILNKELEKNLDKDRLVFIYTEIRKHHKRRQDKERKR